MFFLRVEMISACSLDKCVTRGPFLESPESLRAISGVTIPSVSQERRGFKSSNFTVSLFFATLKTC